MTKGKTLQRFLDAQANSYATALAEIRAGRKRTHWMWYIFPQIKGLGFSETSKWYAIEDGSEAAEYLAHPVLGERFREICKTLLDLPESNATRIFGSPDDVKLQSSMTLFASVPIADNTFEKVLQKYFNSGKDKATLRILATGG